MQKLKKMLLISSLVLASSCQRVPEPPELKQIAPIWKKDDAGVDQVIYWHGINSKSQSKFNLTNAEARSNIMLCTDLDSYQKAELYKQELESLAKKHCK